MSLMRPWPRGEHVRSPWGYRTHPISGKRKLHRGVDVAYHGDIYAPADGTVVAKGVNLDKRTGGGYTLRIRHDSPRVHTVYYHLRQPSHLMVGSRVRRGEVVGQTGTTGASTGVHLHFETRKPPGVWGTDFDPMTILSSDYAAERPAPSMRQETNPEDSMVGRQSPGLRGYGNYMQRFGQHVLRRFGR